MTGYFPIPTNVSGIWKRDPLGRGSIRDVAKWEEMERERHRDRLIACVWRDCALADGWSLEPTYQHEPAESHGTIAIDTRIGMFKGHVMARPSKRGETERDWSLGMGEVTVWAPDSLQIRVPLIYPGIEAIIAMTRHCNNCHADDVDTQRYSFAGRCCAACRPEMARIHERPGWTD